LDTENSSVALLRRNHDRRKIKGRIKNQKEIIANLKTAIKSCREEASGELEGDRTDGLNCIADGLEETLKLIQSEPEFLRQPLSKKEIQKQMEETGRVEGVIAVDLRDIIDASFKEFVDAISEKVTGRYLLQDISFWLIGVLKGKALVEVNGVVCQQAMANKAATGRLRICRRRT
jgi:hypothetical protein